ncbi:hypothetical protein BMF94_5124 [Rhodotorula taiwanensis]|uniref:DUF6534 domain-containing protein n=1 Tax=Rhodotorula taiwanensis TaxID=741276 RepID=A0A2S5B4Q1_9BASI|nr:hypothetical protein BMF94_5124 [Rhodotorula taiwanensis]
MASMARSYLGAIYLGTMLNNILIGMLLVQAIGFFRHDFQGCRSTTKLMVIAILVLSLVQTAFEVFLVWSYNVDQKPVPSDLNQFSWSLNLMPLLTACTVTLVQSHYITVLYRITGRAVWLAAITAILTAAQLAFALFVTVCAFNEDLWQANITKVRPALATWLFLCAGADVLITSGITYSLRRIQVDFARTNDLIGRLVQLTLANNGLTAICAVATAVSFVAADGLWWAVAGFALPRLYANSYISSVTARRRLVESRSQQSPKPLYQQAEKPGPLRRLRAALPGRRSQAPDPERGAKVGHGPLRIAVQTEKVEHSERHVESRQLGDSALNCPRVASPGPIRQAPTTTLSCSDESYLGQSGGHVTFNSATSPTNKVDSDGTLGSGSRPRQQDNPAEVLSRLARDSCRKASFLRAVRCKDSNKAIVLEALRRAQYKFPGQKIIISKKWGFTNLSRAEYLEKRSIAQPDGAYVQFVNPHGPLLDNLKRLERIGV